MTSNTEGNNTNTAPPTLIHNGDQESESTQPPASHNSSNMSKTRDEGNSHRDGKGKERVRTAGPTVT